MNKIGDIVEVMYVNRKYRYGVILEGPKHAGLVFETYYLVLLGTKKNICLKTTSNYFVHSSRNRIYRDDIELAWKANFDDRF